MEMAHVSGKAGWGVTHLCYPRWAEWDFHCTGPARAVTFPTSRIPQEKPHITFRTPHNHSQGALQHLSDRVICRVFESKRSQATGKKMETSPKSVTVQVAFELAQAGHRYLDVRTLEEFNAGHVEDAINVPYMFKAGEGMAKKP